MAISDHILRRIEDKKTDFTKYGFSRVESNALKTFFDLAQEFDTIEGLYQVSVAIPVTFFKLDARLYVIDANTSRLVLVSTTSGSQDNLGSEPPPDIKPSERPYYVNSSLVLTIRGNRVLLEQLPLAPYQDVIGLLEVYPCSDLSEHQQLFFEKYANRIGFSIHLRFLLQKNIEHVKFIKGLVFDIEHNVIVPNMVFKLYLRRLRGKILKNREIEKLLRDPDPESGSRPEVPTEALLAELAEVNTGLLEEFRNIDKHYRSTSLFLETLLRKSHFDEGRLTLRTKPCNMKKAVVDPQLERFATRFEEKGVVVDDRFSGIPDEEMISVVDVGIMAQVYSNLFSNALKYTRQVTTEAGEKKKYIAYGRQVLKDHFGPGKDGIKYNVFSTGPHIPQEERNSIFREGYRADNALNSPGTGHGLSFVKHAVEMHSGSVGYEATRYGNNFYFILPQ